MSDEATKLPADYGIAVGTEWIDDDDGEVVTVTGIDDPATMYPIAFRWNDGHEGADDVDGFCASFRPRDWTALATSEAASRADAAALREQLAAMKRVIGEQENEHVETEVALKEARKELDAAGRVASDAAEWIRRLAEFAPLLHVADRREGEALARGWLKEWDEHGPRMPSTLDAVLTRLATAEALALTNGEARGRAEVVLRETRAQLSSAEAREEAFRQRAFAAEAELARLKATK